MALNIKQEVNKVIKQINAVTSTKIYLFGSYAWKAIIIVFDLCVITNDSNIRKRDLIRLIRESISKVATKPVDILVYDQDEFLERAKINTTLEHKITNEGVSVYEQ